LSILHIAALAASHNRKEKTLASIGSLFAQRGIEGVRITVFLVDDGSTDGTSEAVAAEFPQVRLLHGDGSLYWNGGMRKAFAQAMQEGFDAYLWFNDDSCFFPDALARLLDCAQSEAAKGRDAIVAGSMCDPQSGNQTYGGFYRRAQSVRLYFDPVTPDPVKALPCDTMNGNFTLVPASIARVVGNLDPTFRHQVGDLDYGMRARKQGFPILVAPGYFGHCSINSHEKTWRDSRISRRKRWQHLMSPKGAPFREWFLFTYRHYGWRWPFYAISPYIKTLLH
jgi:GT2 family glycosyltransferase